jgi:dynein heavy chain
VDDLNMPNKEKYGAQPPIEILRQMMDQQGWYDYKDKDKVFKNIENCIFVGAMGPPGGGRTFITPRFLRHLSMISLTSFDDDTLNRIFGTILRWFFTTQNFPQDIVKLDSKIVACTLEIYKIAMKELLPTPTKSHYLFNLRDFAKVILGVCLADKDKINETNVVARLWTHEVWRVFADRLVNDDDRMLMLRSLREVMRKSMGLNFDTVFEHLDKMDAEGNKDGKVDQLDELRGLMFTDCMTPMGAPKRFYEEVLEQGKLQAAVDTSLENFNMMSDKPMDLVLFSFAVEHLLIIGRIMKQPLGNALLVGVGGSGR